ncbi:MAG: S41 family peptidase [Spirochaetales bacterium]|jgi:carboxyl-terminal processing protease|nr:S41 family peptidase [Spirochaetales bacterium]
MKNKERYIWMSAVLIAMVLIALVSFGPSAIAQSKTTDSEELIKTFKEVFDYIKNNYVEEIDPTTLFEGALNGMFDTLDDPYSYYLDPADMDAMSLTTTGNFGGVGLTISKQSRSDSENSNGDDPLYVEVVSPIEGTPAYRAGISAGDLIIKIEDESTENFTIDEAVDRIRGVPGTSVVVTIRRGKTRTFDVEIVRDVIEVPTVKSGMIDSKIAYLKITQFTPFTDDRVEESLKFFDEQQFESLIIDLRNNPGGRLSSVVQIADLLLREGNIVSTRSRVPQENEVFPASRRSLISDDLPILVLINKGSASASEILAGALRDNGKAKIIGETSYGKGSVQQVRSFGEGGFKLTTSRYYTPSGKNIDEVGIVPDTEISQEPLTEEEEVSLELLNEGNEIAKFVEATQTPEDSEIDDFLAELQNKGIMLEDRLIKRLIRNEVNRTNNDPPVFDLEYDLVLQEAVRQLSNGNQ